MPGTYSLKAGFANSSWYDENYIAYLTASFTIINKSITVDTTPVRDTREIKIDGTISYSHTIELSGSVKNSPYYTIYKFTPLDDCTIKYNDNHKDSNTSDICIDIYDKTTNSFIKSLDESANISFTKDHEYLIRVRHYFSTSSSFTYSFTFTNEALAEN